MNDIGSLGNPMNAILLSLLLYLDGGGREEEIVLKRDRFDPSTKKDKLSSTLFEDNSDC
jgi:hypothetical protein